MFNRRKPKLDAGRLLQVMGPDLQPEEAAAVLYVEEGRVKKWIKRPNTKLDPYEADELAMRIGMHPFQVWKWDWIDVK